MVDATNVAYMMPGSSNKEGMLAPLSTLRGHLPGMSRETIVIKQDKGNQEVM